MVKFGCSFMKSAHDNNLLSENTFLLLNYMPDADLSELLYIIITHIHLTTHLAQECQYIGSYIVQYTQLVQIS